MARDVNAGNILDFIDCGADGNKDRFLAFYNAANNMPIVINRLKPLVACLRNIAKNIEQLRKPKLDFSALSPVAKRPFVPSLAPHLTFPFPTTPKAPIDIGPILKKPIDLGPIFKGPMHSGPLPSPVSPDAPPGLAPLPAAGEEATASSGAALTTSTTRSGTSATNPFLTRTSSTTPGAAAPMETSTKVMIGVAALAVGSLGLFWWMNHPATEATR
jgi:hypothetical protein